MNNSVLVEVIIPVYNTEKYLNSCLTSLVNQTFTSWHATIIDDGSTDASANICHDFCNQYPKKFNYFLKPHEGPGDARNYALDRCNITAEALYFLDSDDFIDSDMLEKMFAAMKNDHSQIAVCGYVRHFVNKQQKFKYGKKGVIDSKELCVSLLKGEEIGNFSCNKLFKSELFKTLRFPKKCFYEDVATIYKAILNCERISVLQETFYHYVWHEGSIVFTNDIGYLKDLRAAILKRNLDIIERFPDLKDLTDINELETNIYIFNQMCKKSYRNNLQYYTENLKLIKNKSYLYGKLSKKKKMMAYMIKFCPRVYGYILLALKNVHL